MAIDTPGDLLSLDLDLRGPYRRPLLNGTLVYFNRDGEVEWQAPRSHPESSPEFGMEWWWTVPLGEMVNRLADLGDEVRTIANRLNVEPEAVEHFLRPARAVDRRAD